LNIIINSKKNKIRLELFESKIEFPELPNIGFLIKNVFLSSPEANINNPVKRRLCWILAARGKTTRDTAWQTAKMDSAEKSTLEKHI